MSRTQQVYKIAGPIILSALSILISFIILQPIALHLNPNFNLLASRGIGKVAFVTMIILQLLLFLTTQSQKFLNKFLQTSLYFFKEKKWVKTFLIYFVIFFILHSLLLVLFYFLGYAQYNPNWGNVNIGLILKLIWGFFVVFMLAWTEELIFRGMIYQYINQEFSKITSLFSASLIFMLAHDLTNPLNLITKNWKLGLGLFLLGFLLNTVFAITNKLYAGMGIHAGLVFVKVVLRKARFLIIPGACLPFWLNSDLRQCLIVHILFVLLITGLLIKYRKILLNIKTPQV
ncbi:MAG: CPBP family intramembrane glutamic endopeptidase [bacterium]